VVSCMFWYIGERNNELFFKITSDSPNEMAAMTGCFSSHLIVQLDFMKDYEIIIYKSSVQLMNLCK